MDTSKVDGQDLGDLPHDWDTTHPAWHGGRYDQWILGKSEMTMSHFDVGDIPFHRALASAFTICDHYFCSIQGPTTPNRLYHWTGTIDPDGAAGGPATYNPADYQSVYSWTTYPERLQAAGVSWQVYANDEVGDGSDGFVGDYGDNPLWLFQAYHDALASSDPAKRQLAERASLRTAWKPDSGLGKNVDHVLAQFIADCAASRLPAVSWVVAPYGYSEHPSPWSRGGWVNSQVFDHTSVLRFLEAWTGVREENISAWRRAICGDLTSCFDFRAPDFSVPTLPDTAALRRDADANESKLPKPSTPPLGQQVVPTQDAGSAPTRPLPYQAMADLTVVGSDVRLDLSNAGTAAVPLAVYAHHLLSLDVTPYDVGPGASVSPTVGWTC